MRKEGVYLRQLCIKSTAFKDKVTKEDIWLVTWWENMNGDQRYPIKLLKERDQFKKTGITTLGRDRIQQIKKHIF